MKKHLLIAYEMFLSVGGLFKLALLLTLEGQLTSRGILQFLEFFNGILPEAHLKNKVWAQDISWVYLGVLQWSHLYKRWE
jgi:hypothetical protein